MRRAGLVDARRAGRFVYCRLADDAVLGLLSSLRRIGERNVAAVEGVVRSYFRERDALEPVSRSELLKRIRAGIVTVLDVRPADEFALGHLPGALHIPLGALKRRLKELDRDKPVVAYCRGAYCVLAYEAVALLRSRGFDVRRLEEGLPEWRAAGLPVEQTAPDGSTGAR
jgi:ArsR family transcriptional regulator